MLGPISERASPERNAMMDIVFVAVIGGFFAATLALARFCDRLLHRRNPR